MKKTLIASALLAAFAAPVFAADAAPAEHTFTGNVGLTSNYIFRGISQSQHKPAIQGGFDYSHASGLYAGVWGSNVSWVSLPNTTYKTNNSLELDLYAGYKKSLGDFSYDLGAIRYYYPGDLVPNGVTPDSTEVYGAIGWKFITLKYSHTVSKHLFGWAGNPDGTKNVKGSGYLDLSANYDLGNGWGINGHIGHQSIKNNAPASYTDYKVGVTKDVGFGVFGLAYTSTNAEGSCSKTPTQSYCWNNKDVGKDRFVLSFSKTF